MTKLLAPVSGSANTTVTFNRVASISFEANGTYLDSDSTEGPSAGDTMSYVFGILNTGTTTLWSVEISSNVGGSPVCVPPLASLELAPGDTTECRSTYRVGRHSAKIYVPLEPLKSVSLCRCHQDEVGLKEVGI